MSWLDSPEGRAIQEQVRAQQAEFDRRRALTSTGPVRITRVIPYDNFPNANIYVKGDPSLLPGNPLTGGDPFLLTTVSMHIPGWEHVRPGNVVVFDLQDGQPTAVHLVERGEATTYRAAINGCRIDLLEGGEFTVTAPDRADLHVQVSPDLAHRFISLRNRDIVQVTLTADGQGVDAFFHLSRANGAQPRNPADFPGGF
jgi:hypothetical protein